MITINNITCEYDTIEEVWKLRTLDKKKIFTRKMEIELDSKNFNYGIDGKSQVFAMIVPRDDSTPELDLEDIQSVLRMR
jgi:hypothetical protein